MRQSIVRELPWIIGAILGVVAMIAAVPSIDHPYGSNWPIYFEAARFFEDPTAAYSGWRQPIYPLIQATLGPSMGFVAAGQLLARIGVGLIVVATALLGRALAGPWVGALAALAVPCLECAVEASAWMNMYPLGAASCSLAIALGAVCARWPTVLGALAAGALAALSWKINHLGLLAVPTAGCLVVVGMLGRLRAWRRIALPVAFAVGIGGVVQYNQWIIDTWRVPQDNMDIQILQRRREALEQMEQGSTMDPTLPACTDFVPKPINIRELTNDCAQQFLVTNWGTVQREDCAPSPVLLLVLLPCILLPASWAGRGRWDRIRSSMGSALVFGGPAGALVIGALWTWYAEKYMLTFVSLMATLVPLAGARLGAFVGGVARHPRLGRGVGLLAAALWMVFVWPRPQGLHADRVELPHAWEMVAGEIAQWARTSVGPDDRFLDCVPLRVDLVILPQKIPYFVGNATQDPCAAWVSDPPEVEGDTFLLFRSFDALAHTQPEVIASHGWTLLGHYADDHSLWVRRAGEP